MYNKHEYIQFGYLKIKTQKPWEKKFLKLKQMVIF